MDTLEVYHIWSKSHINFSWFTPLRIRFLKAFNLMLNINIFIALFKLKCMPWFDFTKEENEGMELERLISGSNDIVNT